jgi:aryl-alcohol dehydrogenase-like predicted oxidoreductase
VTHRTDEDASLHRQIELAQSWQSAGLVREIGLGMARLEDLPRLPSGHPITHVLSPYNAFNTGAATLFREARARGLRTVAMSPFVRGWNLEKIGAGADKADAAALLLRWVTSQEIVDTVFVSMRRAEWVRANREAERQGALTDAEDAQVREWVARVP